MKSINDVLKMAKDDNNVIAAMMFLRDSNKNLFNTINLLAAELESEAEVKGCDVAFNWNRVDGSMTLKLTKKVIE